MQWWRHLFPVSWPAELRQLALETTPFPRGHTPGTPEAQGAGGNGSWTTPAHI